jgi:hypothetical protein
LSDLYGSRGSGLGSGSGSGSGSEVSGPKETLIYGYDYVTVAGELLFLTSSDGRVMEVWDWDDSTFKVQASFESEYVFQKIAVAQTPEPHVFRVALLERAADECESDDDPEPVEQPFRIHSYMYHADTRALEAQDVCLCPDGDGVLAMRYGPGGVLYVSDATSVCVKPPTPGSGWTQVIHEPKFMINDFLPCVNGVLCLNSRSSRGTTRLMFSPTLGTLSVVWQCEGDKYHCDNIAVIPSLPGILLNGEAILVPEYVFGMTALRTAWVTAVVTATPAPRFFRALPKPGNKRPKPSGESESGSGSGAGAGGRRVVAKGAKIG